MMYACTHEYADFCTASLNAEKKVRMKIGEGTQCSYCSYVPNNYTHLFCDNIDIRIGRSYSFH